MDKDLQLFSFLIDEDTIDDVNLYAFKLPDEVREIIEILTKSNDNDKKNSLSNKTIYKVATAIFKDIIYCNNRMCDIIKDENRWVYSLEEFDIGLLKEKIKDWLIEEAKNKGNEKIRIEFIDEWEYEKINLKEIYKNNKSNIYNLIPQYYIYKLSKQCFNFETLNKQLKFYRVLGETGVAEMFTLPEDLEINKVDSEKKKYKDMLSYVISVKLKTPIDINKHVLNIKLSTRIWNTYPIIRKEKDEFRSLLREKEATSVYLYKRNPYYNFEEINFNKMSIYRNEVNTFKYKNTCDKLFSNLLDIDINKILFNQIEYLNINNDQEVIALFIKKNSENKDVEYGPGLPERNEVLSIVKNKLSNLQLRDPIKYLSKGGRKKYISFSTTDAKEYNFQKYIPQKPNKYEELVDSNKELSSKAYLLNTNHKKMIINICTKYNDLIEMIIGATKVLLRMKYDEKENLYINNNGLKVEFNIVDNDFALYIKDDESEKDRVDKIKEIFEIDNEILQTAIIDIARYDLIEGQKEKDSKYIVRNALKECKVISQFISFIPNEEVNKNKKIKATSIDTIFSTVKDLISACGFVEGDLYEITGLEKDDILLAVGKVSTKDNRTRIAMSKIEKGIIYYKIYPHKMWKESKEFIYNINKKLLDETNILDLKPAKRQNINQWILDNIDDILKSKEKVYCYVDCSMRSIWKHANNTEFLNFENLALTNKENLRFIRFNITDELPDYFVYKESKNNINRDTGIFKSINSTYYLIGAKHEGNKVRNSLTKINVVRKPIKRQILCEINIQGTELEDEKDKIAIMTQMLRRMNISYKLDSSLPLPIYCFNRIGEYMISLSKVIPKTNRK